jgi:hypothetical protein
VSELARTSACTDMQLASDDDTERAAGGQPEIDQLGAAATCSEVVLGERSGRGAANDLGPNADARLELDRHLHRTPA